MSTAFTAPADQTWQTLLSEITLAYDERRQAISQSAYLPPAWLTETTFATGEKCRYDGSFWESLQNANTNNLPEGLFRTWFPDQTYAVGEKLLYDGGYWASLQDDNTGNLPNEAESEWWEQAWWRPVQGTDVQAATYWVTLQSWLETECLSFIDHVKGPLNDDEDAFLYFTLTTWRTTAGLNSSGFRRSTDNGASYSYGQMQAGDQIGPWIFEDLQKGFGALKWVVTNGTFSGTDANAAGQDYRPTWDAAQEWIIWAWENYLDHRWWGDEGPYAWYNGAYGFGGDYFSVQAYRGVGKYTIPSLSIPHIISLYLYSQKPSGSFTDISFDDNGDAFTENEYFLKETSGGLTSTSWVSSIFGALSIPNVCSTPDSTHSYRQGYSVTNRKGLIKYSFTNA